MMESEQKRELEGTVEAELGQQQARGNVLLRRHVHKLEELNAELSLRLEDAEAKVRRVSFS